MYDSKSERPFRISAEAFVSFCTRTYSSKEVLAVLPLWYDGITFSVRL